MSDPMAEDLECREVVEVVTDYLEGAMPPGERLRFDHHLALCEGCQAYLEQMRTVIRVAGRPAVDAVPPATMDGLLRAFRDWRR